MKVLNAFRAKIDLPRRVPGFYVKFESLDIEKLADRRAFLQSIVGTLGRSGFDAIVAPRDKLDRFDVAVLEASRSELEGFLKRYRDLSPRVVANESFGQGVVAVAWQNRVRIWLLSRRFLKVGDRYISESDVRAAPEPYKGAFRLQTSLENGHPVVWVDARVRIMHGLTKEQIAEADQMGDESEVRVRVLPTWIHGILVGRTGKRAGQMEFPHGGKSLPGPEYWRAKHRISLVTPQDEMLDVFVPAYGRTLPYPLSCVFAEFKRGQKLPSGLKKDPSERIRLANQFVRIHLNGIRFLGAPVEFEGPLNLGTLGFKGYEYQSSPAVIVGSNSETPVSKVHGALKKYGPYAGSVDGKFVVIHSGKRADVAQAMEKVARAYSQLRLGALTLLTTAGDGGYFDTSGERIADFTSTVAELRSTVERSERVLALLILPSVYSSEVYYKARGELFERVFGTEPFPCQAFGMETVKKVLGEDGRAYAIAANTASQCYVKYGGTGFAVWVLKEAADSRIPGISPGSSCYAYHDVSRRPKLKASATAYSAMTDSYGRYIATGTKPAGGEKLSPLTFYDILVELIQKIVMFNKSYSQLAQDPERRFSFERLVFAKDGVIREDEARMMEDVIRNGIPEDNREPIQDLLERISMFPDRLIIDIISVNKSPNKRVFEAISGGYSNVNAGTALAYDDTTGLLVSFATSLGSAQPIEISLKAHLCLNYDAEVPTPHISNIMEEYYMLTVLNWSSLFRQGKYALPQILTQNLGENISAGVRVPDDMPVL